MGVDVRWATAVRVTMNKTGVSEPVAIEVLKILSDHSDYQSAISCIDLAQFYEIDPVWFAKQVRRMADNAPKVEG